MTRKSTPNYSLIVLAPFIAILIAFVAMPALAQATGAVRSAGNADALLVPPGAHG